MKIYQNNGRGSQEITKVLHHDATIRSKNYRQKLLQESVVLSSRQLPRGPLYLPIRGGGGFVSICGV